MDVDRPATSDEAAIAILSAFDESYRAAAAAEGAEGMGGAISANAWAASVPKRPLLEAVRTLCAEAERRDGSVILGICADDAASGVAALKAWVSGLNLPRGVLHGMDKDGVPLDMSSFGAVYIKYNSHSTGVNAPGSATLSGYGGDFRGVYYQPEIDPDAFHQCAHASGGYAPLCELPRSLSFACQPLKDTHRSAIAILHRQGWVKLPSEPDLLDGKITEALEAIRTSSYEPIFNGQLEGESPLRLMGRRAEWATPMERVIEHWLRKEGMLKCSDGTEKSVNDCYALR
ncbi:MAG: hypothetical protein SGPRY_011374, partial [Prymnesium sp.]